MKSINLQEINKMEDNKERFFEEQKDLDRESENFIERAEAQKEINKMEEDKEYWLFRNGNMYRRNRFSFKEAIECEINKKDETIKLLKTRISKKNKEIKRLKNILRERR